MSTSCSLAKSGSTCASGMVWKAVSHAANHGYSHSSGMEMTSARARWRQPVLRRPRFLRASGAGWSGAPSGVARAALRAGLGGGGVGVAVEPLADVEAVELLGPEQARVGAAGDVA